jgi:heptosyltransferase I
MTEQNFLVVRLGSLGDIVHTFPAVAALHESFPASRIVWVTHPRWEPLVRSGNLATETWPVDTRNYSSIKTTLANIKQTNFTAAIDYQGLWKSAALPFLGGVRRRIGFSSESIREFGVPILYTDRVRTSSPHIVDQNGELTLQAGSCSAVASLELSIPGIQEAFVLQVLRSFGIERYVVLSPGGGWLSKCWPAERFGHLCQKIFDELNLRCIINHGPGEEELVKTVKAASRESSPVAYNGTLQQLMALLRNAACIVAGDTGPLHLAIALGTPALALFGPTDPARNGPYRMQENASPAGSKDIVLRSPSAVTTYKRGNTPDNSMLELDVDTVFVALRKLLGVAQ